MMNKLDYEVWLKRVQELAPKQEWSCLQPNWPSAFEDRMSPEQAVEHFKAAVKKFYANWS